MITYWPSPPHRHGGATVYAKGADALRAVGDAPLVQSCVQRLDVGELNRALQHVAPAAID